MIRPLGVDRHAVAERTPSREDLGMVERGHLDDEAAREPIRREGRCTLPDPRDRGAARRVSRLLIATTNRGKQQEFRRLLAPLAAELVTPDMVAGAFPCGPDVDEHVEKLKKYADAGFDELYVAQTVNAPDAAPSRAGRGEDEHQETIASPPSARANGAKMTKILQTRLRTGAAGMARSIDAAMTPSESTAASAKRIACSVASPITTRPAGASAWSRVHPDDHEQVARVRSDVEDAKSHGDNLPSRSRDARCAGSETSGLGCARA